MRFARSITSPSVGISKRPLNCCGLSASGWTARSVLISASVKSEAKKPVSATPSTTLVVNRSANSGWLATSVVLVMFGSWRAIRWPSLVATRSGSM